MTKKTDTPQVEAPEETTAPVTAGAKPRKAAEQVTPMDFTKPYFVTVRQTDTRNVMQYYNFEGTAVEGFEAVLEIAQEEAARLKTTVAIFGPQTGVVEPPKPAPPTFRGMDFS
jgi:hypothetical protein